MGSLYRVGLADRHLAVVYGILIGSIGDDPHGKFASYDFTERS